MAKPNDLDETASRANDHKENASPSDDRAGRVTDGKSADVPQGGKRRGPGRWVSPQSSGD